MIILPAILLTAPVVLHSQDKHKPQSILRSESPRTVSSATGSSCCPPVNRDQLPELLPFCILLGFCFPRSASPRTVSSATGSSCCPPVNRDKLPELLPFKFYLVFPAGSSFFQAGNEQSPAIDACLNRCTSVIIGCCTSTVKSLRILSRQLTSG